MRKTLDELAIGYQTDKATAHDHPHGYAPHYERFFAALRDQPIKLMEIGVGSGPSIRLWLEYFQQAQVFGIDIHGSDAVTDDRYTFVQGDQASPEFWGQFLAQHGGDWDVIIDDGGHFSGGIAISFASLWPSVKPAGYYVIEDLGCSYNPVFHTPGFPVHMDQVKAMLDQINRAEASIANLYFSKELVILQKNA